MPRLNFRYLISRSKKARLLLLILIVGMILYPINLAYNRLAPLISELSISIADAMIIESIADHAAEYDFNELIILKTSRDGAISSIHSDTARINTLAAEFASFLTDKLSQSTARLYVPIGDVISIPAILGTGPSIPVRITGYSSSKAEVNSEFSSAGINQTLHRITMSLTVEYTLLLPKMQVKRASLTTEVLLAETVIIGSVPSIYR